MNQDGFAPDHLLDEIASCLAQVRDHIYRANVGAMVVEAGCHLFDLEREPSGVSLQRSGRTDG